MKLLVTLFTLVLASTVFATDAVKPVQPAASTLGQKTDNKVDCSTISNRTVTTQQTQGGTPPGTPIVQPGQRQ